MCHVYIIQDSDHHPRLTKIQRMVNGRTMKDNVLYKYHFLLPLTAWTSKEINIFKTNNLYLDFSTICTLQNDDMMISAKL